MDGARSRVLVAAFAFAVALTVALWTLPRGNPAEAAHSAGSAHEAEPAAAAASPGAEHDGTSHDASGAGGADGWKAMDDAMAKRDKSFPAATKGQGGQDLAPTVLPDGTKEFHLTAKAVKWEVEPGKVVDAWGFNGMVPGPTIRADVGDKVRIVVKNELPEPTSVHWHGIQLPNKMDGVPNVTQDSIKPGKTFAYEFPVTRIADTWYHSHYNGTKQVSSGLWGAIQFGDVPTPHKEKVAQKQIIQIQDAGVIGMTLNGKSFPATKPLKARVGDWVQVTYVNAGTMAHPMHLHGVDQVIIAKDGFPLEQTYKADTVNVAPGERYTVLIHADQPGKWIWHCHIFPHAEGSQGMFGLVMEMQIT
ncbi:MULTISPECIES: multicopper oxidase family protein [Actinomadura]|uniref:multicopper oxidase family protein n=1 Tax=Actinomadura TaxID=1988 RepID=UPI002609AC4D|nr:multicopper oxidase domain-containing protein [Actinomadura geliboluensis]